MSNPLSNELLGNPLSSSANAGQYEAGDTISTIHGDMTVTGVDELGRPQVDRYGEDLNWEDSFGPASKHLGVSEAEWKAFISGVNDIKAEMRQYEGNDARVMQQRTQGEDPVAERRIGVLMNTQGLTREQAENEVYNSEQYIKSNEQFEQYNELNQQLNDLYASVGLDSAGAITGSGTNSPGYAVNFDFVSGDVSHTKGDAVHSMGKMAVMAAAGVVAGPALAGALGGVLGPAAAKAASSAIINLASQYMTTGEVDWKQALISAATSYGGAKLGEALKGSSALGGIGDKISGVTDKFNEVLDKTGNIGSAAIKAGGMSMLTQLVTTGEIDVKQAGLAALMAGGSAGLSEWQASMEAAGVQPDEYMQDLAEMEEFQQAAIDADIKDPFLNPNYETVGDGVIVNINTGDVFGYGSDKSLGKLNDLDLDGDGMLSGNDLQEIDVPERDRVINRLPPGPGQYYDLDGDGQYTPGVDRDLRPPPESGTLGGAYDLSNPEYVKQFDEYSDQQMIDKLDAMGVEVLQREDGSLYLNPEQNVDDAVLDNIDQYLDARNQETYLLMNQVDHGGGLIEYKDQPYTVGITDEGQHYIIKTDELGNSRYTSISEEDYNVLADMQDNENYVGIDEYVSNNSIGSTGTEFGEYNPDGTMVGDLNGDGVISSDEIQSGSTESTQGEGWLVLDEGASGNAVQVDDFVQAEPDPEPVEPVEPEPVEPEKVENNNNNSANSNANSSTDAGEGDKGGGNTNATGGLGAIGGIGGGGTPGAGAPAGGSSGVDNNEIVVDINNPLTGGNVTDNVVTDDSLVDPSNGTGTPVAPPMNAQIQALMDAGMTYEEAVESQNAAIAAGADANGDGMVTDEEWAAHTGLGGAGGSAGGTDAGEGTGGAGDGTSSGAGSTGGAGAGAGTGTGDGGSGSGSGASGDTAGGDGEGGGVGDGGGVGEGEGGGEGGGFYHGGSSGAGVGSGTEPGAGGGAGGGGEGGGEGVGLLAGFDNYTPQWGELFEYTTITPYQAKQLEPVRQYIAKAKGMLS